MEQLKLYGLFKQAKLGDTTEKRPGMTKVRARAKHDAWAGHAGTSKEDAMRKYMELVDQLAKSALKLAQTRSHRGFMTREPKITTFEICWAFAQLFLLMAIVATA